MSIHLPIRFTRRTVLAALVLLPTDYALAVSPQPPASQTPEPPAPASVAPAIAQAAELFTAKKFAEAIAVLEEKQKALGTGITDAEKRALLVAVAETYSFWGREAENKYQEALGNYQHAYAIDKEYRPQKAAADLDNIGQIYSNLGEKTKALDFFNKSFLISQAIGHKQGEANTLNNIGAVYSDLGELSKSLEFYNKALPIFQTCGDKADEASTLNDIGWVCFSLGEPVKAFEFYNKAVPIFQIVGDKRGEANTLTNLGFFHSELGEPAKALEFYNKALPISQTVGDKRGEANTLTNIGWAYLHLGEFSKSLEFYNRALPIFQIAGDKRGEATALTGIGAVYSNLGEPAKALEFYNKALPIFQAVGDKSGEASTLTNIGTVYSDLGESAKALEFYNRSLPIRRAIGDKSGEAGAARNLMSLFKSAKNPFRNPYLAVTFGKQSVNLYQTLRTNLRSLDKDLQSGFTQKVEFTYRELADLLISLGRLPEAQQVLGLLKEQEFADFIKRDAKLAEGTPQADYTPREAEAKKRYDSAGEKITTLAAEYETVRRANVLEPSDAKNRQMDALEKQLDAAQVEFARVLAAITLEFQTLQKNDRLNMLETIQKNENFAGTLRVLSEQTKQNVVAVYTLVAPERLHCLVITPHAQIARSTPLKDTDLNKLVQNFRIALENPTLDPRPLGKKLYDLIIAPIEADLKGAGADSILWSLDGTLRYLPLAALSPDGKTYLVDRTQKSSLFTPASLQNLKDENQKSWSAAAFGVTRGRTEEGLTFSPLPGVSEEIRAVGQTVSTRVFLDDAFTESSLRSALRSRPALVHIASHFAFRPSNPTGSFLLLGKGTLSLDAITKRMVGLFDGVDLLTLSACDTATGSGINENGAEVESFAVLAQSRGASAVLASLWPVSDASTQAMMQTFYALHKANPTLGKVECLRQTQVALLSGKVKPTLNKRGADISLPPPNAGFVSFVPDPNAPCAHPFYWAAFTLIGNTK